MKLTDAKIWNSKIVSLCRVFANRVTIEFQRLLNYAKMLGHNIIIMELQCVVF